MVKLIIETQRIDSDEVAEKFQKSEECQTVMSEREKCEYTLK